VWLCRGGPWFFFHIPFESSPRQRSEARTMLISVFDGSLTVPNIISGLERLIPGTWKWNLQENGNNSFKIVMVSNMVYIIELG
jgi:hypothetical protein